MSISFPSADFAPTLSGYTGQGAFRFWCQKVLPIVYDDSLSYYELLNKVVNYLNNVIADVASVEENIGKLNDSYIDLQNYVNEHMQELVEVVNTFTSFVETYFDNLDVQQEINNKLDQMARDGSLTPLIDPIVRSVTPDIVTEWLQENIEPTTPAIDASLTVSGAGADAKVTGDKIADFGFQRILTSGDDVNTLFSRGVYIVESGNLPANLPDNEVRTIVVFGPSPNSVRDQLMFTYTGKLLSRHYSSGSWTNTRTFSGDADFGYRGLLTANDDINTLLDNGVYIISADSLPQNLPNADIRTIIVLGPTNNAVKDQIMLSYYGNIRCRHYSSESWSDTYSFASLETVIRYMGLLTASDDINTLLDNGVYIISSDSLPQNLPSADIRTIIVLGPTNNVVKDQIMLSYDGNIRCRHYSSGSWSDTYSFASLKTVTRIDNNIINYNSINVFDYAPSSSGTNSGVTYTKNSDGTWTIVGTAGNLSFKNLINSINAIPPYIIRGRKYKLAFNGGNVRVKVILYREGASISRNYTSDTEITIPTDGTGIIVRFDIPSGTTVNQTVDYRFIAISDYSSGEGGGGGTVNNTYNITTTPNITTDTNNWLHAVDTDTESETGKTDMTGPIMSMLNDTGYCKLSEGIFYVSGNIDMPEGSMIEGCGKGTEIRLLQSVNGYVIKMCKYNTISNLCISGDYDGISVTNRGNRSGVLFAANKDGLEGETAFESECCMLDNVWIRDFNDSGIKCHNTSGNVRRGLYVNNVYIYECWCGINIDYNSEFNKIVNACISLCNIACIDNGGNNVFTGCTFHATTVGFKVDGSQPNAAHGTINGCTFCHTGSNNGLAVKFENITAGYIVSNCQFWYNGIDVLNGQGVMFEGCEFGRGKSSDGNTCASINISDGNLVLFSNCMFHMDVTRPATINITDNNKVRFNGCYGTESGNLITA